MNESVIGDLLRQLGPRQAGRARQPAGVGDQVEIIAHRELAVVTGVVGPPGPPAEEGQGQQPGQVVGVDVVGEHVVLGPQHRLALVQPGQRQALGRIVDARRPQQAHPAARAPAEAPQLCLRRHAPGAPGRGRAEAAGFVEPVATAVAIDAGGTYID
jgi:hypothetical protein